MNNKISSWLTIIVMAAIGTVLIVMHNDINLFNWLVRALGICLLIPGAYVMLHSINSASNKKVSDGSNSKNQRGAVIPLTIVSAAAIIFGAWMLLDPRPFVEFFTYLLAGLLLVWGIYMLVVVIYMCRPVVMPWHFYITPCLFIIAGIVLFVMPINQQQSIVALIVGILMILSAVNSIAQHITYRVLVKKVAPVVAEQPQTHKVIDVEHEEEV